MALASVIKAGKTVPKENVMSAPLAGLVQNAINVPLTIMVRIANLALIVSMATVQVVISMMEVASALCLLTWIPTEPALNALLVTLGLNAKLVLIVGLTDLATKETLEAVCAFAKLAGRTVNPTVTSANLVIMAQSVPPALLVWKERVMRVFMATAFALATTVGPGPSVTNVPPRFWEPIVLNA